MKQISSRDCTEMTWNLSFSLLNMLLSGLIFGTNLPGKSCLLVVRTASISRISHKKAYVNNISLELYCNTSMFILLIYLVYIFSHEHLLISDEGSFCIWSLDGS